jgi:RNA polymerase sigma-B factor
MREPGRRERDRVIEQHLPLVRALARRYAGAGEPLDDLVQAGAIGLINAVDRYEPGRGAPLTAYAVPSILGEIRRHLRDRCATVRLPRTIHEHQRALWRADRELRARLGRTPTLAELAGRAGVAAPDAARALSAVAPAPLPADDDPAAPFCDGMGEAVAERVALIGALGALGERERRIVHLRFYADVSQARIARELGLSPVHVSRLLRAALERVRTCLDAEAAVVRPAPAP